jgi:CheY-like chemotaxis protein
MHKVLIVEDDQLVARIYSNKLAVAGFEVQTAFDGEAGLETARRFQPDAVILDLMLPKLTGVDLIRQLRAEPGMAQTPLIVFSSTFLTGLIQEAWKAGATKCLSKANCTPKQVIELLHGSIKAASVAALAPAGANGALSARGANGLPGTVSQADADEQFLNEIRQSLLQTVPGMLMTTRGELQQLIKTNDDSMRVALTQSMCRRVHAITGNAGLAEWKHVSQLADAVESLLRELSEKPKNVNVSTLRTLASAFDFLGLLFQRGLEMASLEEKPPRILVVDDDAISRRAVTYALEKAKLKSVSLGDPLEACQKLTEEAFDLVFLDVDMPSMNGYELCSKLRTLPNQRGTAVVFVTSMNDFESRANSTMSGGTDFIAKPFLFLELAVKALVYVLKGRLPVAA